MSLSDWTTADVATFMVKTGFQEASVQMLDDEIDGEALALCSTADFQQYGIKRGPALKLVQKIQSLHTELAASDPAPSAAEPRGPAPPRTEPRRPAPTLTAAVVPGLESVKINDDAIHKNDGSPFRISDLTSRGKGVVATRKLGVGAVVFKEPALLSVKTIMVFGGVIVVRRSKVEQAYDSLGAAEKHSYRLLHPVCEGFETHSVEGARPANDSSTSLRQRVCKQTGDTNAEATAGEQQDVMPLTAQQHREIWDTNGFHYCGDDDVRINRVLHLAVCPALLSLIVGCAYAHWFQGSFLRAVLGACVLFFAMLGPISTRVCYLGSQALFLQASRLNHSCLPNSTWEIDGQRPVLGGPLESAVAVGKDKDANCVAAPLTLSLRTKRAVTQGEELTIDYIPDLVNLDALERRKLLEQEYGFLCSCVRCTASERKLSAADEIEEEE